VRRFQRDPARVSREALAFLTKAAKGIKGGLDIKALQEALPVLGWSIQDVTVTTPIDGEKVTGQMKDIFQKNGIARGEKFYESYDSPGKKRLFVEGEAAKNLFRDIKTIVTETSNKKPPVAGLGEMILRNLQIETIRPGQWIISFCESWLGFPGWLVKNSQGSQVIFTPKMAYHGRLEPIQETGSTRFWTFAYKSGLKEAARSFLDTMGTDVVQNILKPVDPRTLINTGTCPVCFENIKLVQGRMMRHGWRVAGRRQRGAIGMTRHTGPCFGVGYEPFEISPQGTKDYLKKSLLPAIEKAKNNLAFLKTRPVLRRETRGRYIQGKWVRDNEDIDPTHYEYDRYLESEMDKMRQFLSALEDERDMLSNRIAAWKPKPLYIPPSAGQARDPRYSRRR
jgi:hypothetical protein